MKQMLSEKDVMKFSALIERSKKIVLTCHVRPDGDAIGSTLGFLHLFESMGKEARIVVPDQPPKTLAFLPGYNNIAVYTRFDPYCTRIVSEADLIVCCDFNTPSRQDQMANLILDAKCPKVLVDHHQHPDYPADLIFSYPDMSATCELAFRIIAAMGLFTALNKEAATCLLTGIVTDTRNFTVNVKNPDIYDILMYLIEKGANKDKIVKEALNTRSLASLKIQAYAISERMEIFDEHKASIITLDRETLKKFHYEKGDTEGLVNLPLEVRGMVSSFFLREDPEYIRISARSVEPFPVADVCTDVFGGGGHPQAAGAEFKGSLEECKRKLVEALPSYDRFLPKKHDKNEN